MKTESKEYVMLEESDINDLKKRLFEKIKSGCLNEVNAKYVDENAVPPLRLMLIKANSIIDGMVKNYMTSNGFKMLDWDGSSPLSEERKFKYYLETCEFNRVSDEVTKYFVAEIKNNIMYDMSSSMFRYIENK